MAEGTARPRGEPFSQLNRNLQQSIASFGQLTAAAGAFGMSLRVFREFERQLTLANSVADGTIEQFRNMGTAIRDFSLATASSANEAGNALYFLASAGFSVEESMGAMSGVLLLSQATLEDVSFTSDVVASNIRAFGLEAADATRISNVFAASITNSQATLNKLAFALRQAGPVAAVAGQEIEQTVGALSALFNVGLRGEQAGTQLRNIIVRLNRPVGEARDLMREYGIATRDAAGHLLNIEDILIQIGKSGMGTAELATIFGTEGVAGGIALMNQALSGDLQNLQDSLTGTNRAFEIAAKQLNTVDGALNLARNSFNEMAISVGEGLAGPVQRLALYFRDLVVAFRELDPEIRSTIVLTGSVVATFLALGPAITTLAFAIRPTITMFRGLSTAAARAGAALPTILNTLRSIAAVSLVGVGTAFARMSVSIAQMIPSVTRLGNLLGGVRGGMFAIAATGATALTAKLVASAGLIWAVGQLASAWWEARTQQREAIQQAREDLRRLNLDIGAEDMQVRLAQIEFAIDTADLTFTGAQRFELANVLQTAIDDLLPSEIESASRQIEQQTEQLSEGYKAARRNVEVIENEIAELQKQRQNIDRTSDEDTGFFGRIADRLAAGREDTDLQNEIDSRMRELNDARLALEMAMTEEDRILRNSIRSIEGEADDLPDEVQSLIDDRNEVIRDFLNILSAGGVDVSSFVPEEQDQQELRNLVRDNIDAVNRGIIEALQTGGRLDLRRILRTIAETEGIAGSDVADAISDFFAEERNRITISLRRLVQDQKRQNARLRADAELAAAEVTGDLEDALRAGAMDVMLDAGDRLERMSDEFRNTIGDRFEGVDIFEIELVEEFAEDSKFAQQAIGRTLGEVLGFDIVSDAVNEAIADGAGPDEVMAIADEAIQVRREAIDAIIAQMRESLDIEAEDLEAFMGEVRSAGDLVADALNYFTSIFSSEQETRASRTRERAERGRGRGGRGGKSPEQLAREAKRARRAYEDAFDDIDEIRRRSARARLDMAQGVGFDTRINVGLELDIADINAEFDAQIKQLERDMEDIEDRFGDQPLELNKLRDAYREVIAEVEKARDAEIAYTQTFTAMSARRDEAIDRQIDSIRNMSMEMEEGLGRISAGFQAGLLLYQKQMRTTVDNVAEFTVSALDGIAEAVGAFVTGQGDALEILRTAVLNALNTLIVDATKRMLQQMAQSLTSSAAAQGQQTGSQMAQAAAGGGQQGGGQGGGFLGRVLGAFGIGGGGQQGGSPIPGAGGPQAEVVQAINMAANMINQQLQVINTTLVTIRQAMSAALAQILANMQAEQLGDTGKLLMGGMQGMSGMPGGMPGGGATGGTTGGGFAGIMSLLGSFAGFFDSGGSLRSGEVGIVGEKRPELVTGPANIIGGRDTAALLGNQPMAQPNVEVSNVIVQDPRVVSKYISSAEGQRQILNLVDRKRGGR